MENQFENDFNTAMESVQENGTFNLGGREYEFTRITHEKRIKVFSFYSAQVKNIEEGNFSFLAFDPFFKEVQKVIETCLKCDGALLKKKKRHWDEYPADFMPCVMTSLIHFSQPFFLGNN